MSSGELVIIFIVAFLVFGPKKLPELARTIGRLLLELKNATQDVKTHMETELDEMKNETLKERPPEETDSREKKDDKAEEYNK